MTIVINEFEVVTEEKPMKPDGNTPTDASKQSHSPAVTPYTIQCIIRQHKERFARVRAH